jgi:hypothetical protein
MAKRDPRLRSRDERPDAGTCNQELRTDEDLRTEIPTKTTVEDPENVECPGSPLFNGVTSVDPKDHNCLCDIKNQEELQQEGPGRGFAGGSTAVSDWTIKSKDSKRLCMRGIFAFTKADVSVRGRTLVRVIPKEN